MITNEKESIGGYVRIDMLDKMAGDCWLFCSAFLQSADDVFLEQEDIFCTAKA